MCNSNYEFSISFLFVSYAKKIAYNLYILLSDTEPTKYTQTTLLTYKDYNSRWYYDIIYNIMYHELLHKQHFGLKKCIYTYL